MNHRIVSVTHLLEKILLSRMFQVSSLIFSTIPMRTVMIAPTPGLHMLYEPHMFSHAIMSVHMHLVLTTERGLNIAHVILALVNTPRVVARDVCLLIYKFNSRVSYLLSFQFCSLFMYRLA